MTESTARRPYMLVSLAAVAALVLLTVVHALLSGPASGEGYAEHVVLQDAACNELRTAKMADGSTPPAQAFPCTFTGYLYATKIPGLIAVDGLSDNVKGRCLTFAGDIIDPTRSYIDRDYPRQPDMPARVLANCNGRFP